MALPVQLPFHDDENLVDFVARLAAANGYPSLRAFLLHTEITAGNLFHGDEDALAVVSTWTDMPSPRLGRLATYVTGQGATWRLGYATLSKDMRPGRTMRFCASCVMSDQEREAGRLVGRAYRRAWWSVRGIGGCPDHGCGITTVEVAAAVDVHDFTHFVNTNLALVEDASINRTQSSTPRLDRYLRDRILKPAPDDFLGSLEAHVAVEFSRYFGDFLKLHGEVNAAGDEDIDFRERGFLIAAGGRSSVRQVIADVIDRKRPSTKYIEAVIGPMARWLRRNAENACYFPVIDLIQNALERSMPFGVGQTILKDVQERHIYCVNSAHAEFGLPKERIRALMASNDPDFRHGLPDGSTYFAAEALRPILEAAAETLTTTEAAFVLGTTEQRVHDLLSAGILEQVEKRGNDVRAYTRIPRTAVEDFSARLASRMPLAASTDNSYTLSAAARLWRRQFHTLVAMILDGCLAASILPGEGPLLKRILLSKRALVEDVSPTAGSHNELVRLKEVELALGTASITVSDLIGRGYLRQKIVRRETGRTVKFVERESLNEFLGAYASLSMIAKSCKGYRALIKKELDDAGVLPIFEPSGSVARFYSRTELSESGYKL
ncbi:TniQ family protein [Rhizobium oryzicola]|uniref:TniQ family protein n=1 Tax=Rhizobium oryzicola TaxID=1232668 RepID=A0ABT8T039_9HYPH|nr:TniQ family protein [Rhizobium oryzicola]MDO1583623.1 TniQ family protein [Rhizobium oryzicola]